MKKTYITPEMLIVVMNHVPLLISASVNGSTIEDGGESGGDMWADSRESDFFDDEN